MKPLPFSLVDLMVDGHSECRPTLDQARLTDTAISLENSFPEFHPPTSIAAFMPAATSFVGEFANVFVALVRLAVA